MLPYIMLLLLVLPLYQININDKIFLLCIHIIMNFSYTCIYYILQTGLPDTL